MWGGTQAGKAVKSLLISLTESLFSIPPTDPKNGYWSSAEEFVVILWPTQYLDFGIHTDSSCVLKNKIEKACVILCN